MWGMKGKSDTPIFVPAPALCAAPITVQAGKVVSITDAGFSNDGVAIPGTPALKNFAAIEWTVEGGTAQSYLNADTTKVSCPVDTQTDGIAPGVSAYSIKNNGAAAITLYVRGM